MLKTAFKGLLADAISEKALEGFQTRELDVCAEQTSRSYNKGKKSIGMQSHLITGEEPSWLLKMDAVPHSPSLKESTST